MVSPVGRLKRLPHLALPRNDLVELVQRFTSVAVPRQEGNSVERSVFATIVAPPPISSAVSVSVMLW